MIQGKFVSDLYDHTKFVNTVYLKISYRKPTQSNAFPNAHFVTLRRYSVSQFPYSSDLPVEALGFSVSIQEHGKQPDMGHRSHSPGIPGQFCTGDFPLWSFLSLLHPHPSGEWSYPGAYLLRLKTSHPHVLLPLTLGHHRHILCL